MIVKLPFGRDTVAVDLRGLKVRPLLPAAPRGEPDLGRALSRAVDFPIAGPSLGDLARGRSSAVVVVPDETRRAQLPEALPIILDRLLAGGLDPGSVTILMACGTHPVSADPELAEVVGELPAGVNLRQHSSRDDGGLTRVGQLRPGVPLRIDRQAAAADLLVTVGATRHHYFAGFGGGPKMVFPGIGGYEEIQANHALVLRRGDAGPERHPGCEPGTLVGNPVAEEIARAADVRPPDFSVGFVPGRDGRMAWVGAGPWRAVFDAAVERARAWYEVSAESFDLVVASGGGHPEDGTLIQAHKGLDAACRFVNPGGEVLFVADLGRGSGSPTVAPFLADPRREAILARLAENYVQYGHTMLRILEKTEMYRVHLVSSLAPDLARRLGFLPVEAPAVVVERWRAAASRGRVGVLAEGAVWPRTEALSSSVTTHHS